MNKKISQIEVKESVAEILCIGTELLLGNIANTNAQWLAQELSALGIPHFRQNVIGDNHSRLKELILEISQRSQILITTGGLGPTPDDLTTETIASAFNTELEEREEISNNIKLKMQNNKNISIESIRKQSKVPIGASLIHNSHGIVPGIIWSPKPEFTILTFPGVPAELKEMWINSALPWLKKNKKGDSLIFSKTLKITGINESSLAEIISKELENKNPTIAPYASLGEVKLRITAKALNINAAKKLINPIEKNLRNKIGDNIYGEDKDTLQSVIKKLLCNKKQSISVAESCTGGGIGTALTSVSGSSEYFLGGVIAYNNKIKHDLLNIPQEILVKHGAVSREVVELMAKAVQKKFKSDWSIAVSGVAGPTGGSEKKPIGLIHFCINGPSSINSWYENFGTHRSRNDIQKLSVLKALDQLRIFLLSER